MAIENLSYSKGLKSRKKLTTPHPAFSFICKKGRMLAPKFQSCLQNYLVFNWLDRSKCARYGSH
ncbi:hypothetical protein EMIT0P258_120083 [Pseudomonas sp. IT-P258]